MKTVRVGDNLTDKGRLFQTMCLDTEKSLSTNVVLVRGRMYFRCVAERRSCRPGSLPDFAIQLQRFAKNLE